jgi:hypothetical protein
MKNPIQSKTIIVGSAVALLATIELLSDNLGLFKLDTKTNAIVTLIIGVVMIWLRFTTKQPLKNPLKRESKNR